MSLPGQRVKLFGYELCTTHLDRKAILGICSEADSFGTENTYFCQECVNAREVVSTDGTVGTCDWCNTTSVEVKPMRDPEEGLMGRVYDVCQACRGSNRCHPVETDSPDDDDDDEGDDDDFMIRPEDLPDMDEQVDDDDVRYPSEGNDD